MAGRQADDGMDATEAVLGILDADVADLVRGYIAEPLASADILEDGVTLYFKELESLAAEGAVIDLDFARTLANRCESLLADVDDMPEEHRRLVQAATRYFCVAEDTDGDVESLIGFDDDSAVIDAVARAIGRSDVLED